MKAYKLYVGQNYSELHCELHCLEQGRKSAGNNTTVITKPLLLPLTAWIPLCYGAWDFQMSLVLTQLTAKIWKLCTVLSPSCLPWVGGTNATFAAPEIHAPHPSVHPKYRNLRVFLVFWPYTLQPCRSVEIQNTRTNNPTLLAVWMFTNYKTGLIENCHQDPFEPPSDFV